MLDRLLILGLAISLLAGVAVGDDRSKPTSVSKRPYGTTADGTAVDEYTLTAGPYSAKIITYGAAISELIVPDRHGKPTDVVLGFDDMAGWQSKGNPYFGCIVGRVANRVGNARFTLDGKEYKLAANNGPHSLHGGIRGFDKVVWKVEHGVRRLPAEITLTYRSPDGEEGYPGNLTAHVTYRLSANGTLSIEYSAMTDKATPVNLTNHSYFNLNGAKTGSTVLDHSLMLAASRYSPGDDTLIPTGQIAPVDGTPLDFTKPTPIGERIKQIKATPVGYDHNFVLEGAGTRRYQGEAISPKTGISMQFTTTEPAVQLYTGNFLDGTVKGKGGTTYPQYGGFCLEAQHYPDSINKPQFPSIVLKPGETYKQTTTYQFGAK